MNIILWMLLSQLITVKNKRKQKIQHLPVHCSKAEKVVEHEGDSDTNHNRSS